jgi:PAS domain S-box-containing protein
MELKRLHGSDTDEQTKHHLSEEVQRLRLRLDEANQTLEAIRCGDVDALVINGPQGEQVFSLASAERLYRVIVETMNEAALTVSEQGIILFSNRRFCELTRTPLEDIVGRDFLSFVTPEQQEQAKQLVTDAEIRPVIRLMLLASDGTMVPSQICASSLQSAEGLSVCLVASDLSELEASVRSMHILREQREAVEQARVELAQSNAELSRSRAEALRLMEDALEARRKAEQSAAALREAQDQLERWNVELEQAVSVKTTELQHSQTHLRALASELNLTEQRERKRVATELHDHLQQMLVFGKLTIGQGKRAATGIPACEQVMEKVDEMLSEALAYTRSLVAELCPPVLRDHGLPAALKWLGEYMKKHGQTVTVMVPEHTGLTIPEDQVTLLFQSVRELLINSSKHAETAMATVRLDQFDDHLEIAVCDEGKGFDPATTSKTIDSGLSSQFGLLSIRERMRALGGSFNIQSTPGRGTTATLVLPLLRIGKGTVGSEQQGVETGQRQPATVKTSKYTPDQQNAMTRVLVVDDHAMVRQGLRSVLEAFEDIQVIGEAQDGLEALKLVEERQPQVVVMDINMPQMNGIDATAYIKKNRPETIVIGISVNTGDDNADAMRRAGAVTLLTKEAAVDDLYRTIQDVLRTKV